MTSLDYHVPTKVRFLSYHLPDDNINELMKHEWIKPDILLMVSDIPFIRGQLISKCPFAFIVWTKIPPKNLTNSALEWVGQICQIFQWYFGPNDDTKRTF